MFNTSCLTLHEMVETSVSHHTDSMAVVYDNLVEKVTLTYAQLWKISSKVKDSLSKVVCRNEVVGICPLIDHRMPAVLIGVMRLSATFYSFNVGGGFEYVLKVLRDVGSKVIVIHHDHYKDMEKELISCDCEVISMDTPELEDYFIVRMNNIDSKQHSGDMAYCITTSGTTGTPKVVMVPHDCIVPNIVSLSNIFSLTSNDLVLGATALTFDPSIVELFMTLCSGACILILPQTVKMIPDLLLQCIHERNHVTTMQITPTLLSRFDSEKLSQTILGDSSMLRVMALGGEPFPAGSCVLKLISPGNQTCFYNLYGTTEVSCWATCYKVTDEDIRDDKVIPVGEPLQDTVIEVRDELGQKSTTNEGYLYIGGKKRKCRIGVEIRNDNHDDDVVVMRNTGDLVRTDDFGQIFFMGRKDSQIKRNGQRVNLEEIKMVCLQHGSIDVCEVVVIQERLVVFVCTCNLIGKESAATSNDIHVYLKNHALSHWLPDDILILRNLPITSHGKVDIKALQQIYADKQASNCAKLSLVEYFEKRWLEILGLSTPIPSNASFLLNGGNSLLAVHLVNDVETYSDVQLPALVDMLLNETYSDIQQYLVNKITNCDYGVRNVDDVENINVGNVDVGNIDGVRNVDDVGNVDVGNIDGIANDNLGISGNKQKLNENSNNVTIVEERENDDNFGLPNNVKRKNKSSKHGLPKRCKRNYGMTCSLNRCNHMTFTQGNKINVRQMHNVKQTCRSSELCNGRKTDQSVKISLVEKWKYDKGKCVDASPLLVVAEYSECHVFIGTHSHKFSAINFLSGEFVWETWLPDRIESSACLSACGTYVIVGCYNGFVYMLDVHDGTIWWRYDTGGAVKSSPTVDSETGYVYVGSHSQCIVCLNVNERECVWKTDLASGSIFSSPALCLEIGQVYVATLGGKMFALNMDSGRIVWDYDFHKPVFSSPAVTVSGVCVGCTDGCVYLLSKTGDLVWTIKTENPIFSSPSVLLCNFISMDSVTVNSEMHTSSKEIYESSNEILESSDKIHESSDKIHESSDKIHESLKKIHESSDRIHERITIGSHDKCLYCVTNSGEILWKFKTNSTVYASPYQTVIRTRCERSVKSTIVSEDGRRNCELDTAACESFVEAQKDSTKLGKVDNVDMKPVDRSVASDGCEVDSAESMNLDNVDMKSVDRRSVGSSYEVDNPESMNLGNADNVNMKSDMNYIESDSCEVDSAEPINLDNDDIKSVDRRSEIDSFDSMNLDNVGNVDMKSVDRSVVSGCCEVDSADCGLKLHVVVACSTTGTVYVVDAHTGKLLCQMDLNGEIFSSPVVYENCILIGCRDDFVYCLRIDVK